MFTAPKEDTSIDGGFKAPESDISDSSYVSGFFKTYKKDEPKTDLQKADIAAGKVSKVIRAPVEAGLNLLNAPYEMAGEAIAAPLENRLPIRPTILGGQGAENPISVVNKLLRAGAGAISGIPGGTPMESARAAYNAPPGIAGPIEDTAMAVLMGKLAPEVLTAPADAALAGASKVASGVKNAAGFVGKKAISTAFNVPEESVAARFANPELIKSAGTKESLALNEFPKTADQLKQQIFEGNAAAKETLSTSRFIEPQKSMSPSSEGVVLDQGGAFTKDEVLGAVEKARKEIGGIYTQEGKTAAKTLDNLSEDLNKIRNTVSQNQVHDLIQKLDQEIPWQKFWKTPENLTMEDHAMIDARTNLDSILKDKNPIYAEKIAPISEKIDALKDFVKNFSLNKIKKGGYRPSDTTVSKISGGLNENKLDTQRILNQVQGMTGNDLLSKIQNAQHLENFQPSTGRGDSFYSAVRDTLSSPPMAARLLDVLSKGKTGVGNVLSAVNAQSEGTPLQEIIKRLLANQPAPSPFLRQNQ